MENLNRFRDAADETAAPVIRPEPWMSYARRIKAKLEPPLPEESTV